MCLECHPQCFGEFLVLTTKDDLFFVVFDPTVQAVAIAVSKIISSKSVLIEADPIVLSSTKLGFGDELSLLNMNRI